jgi:hypothetical protein
LPAPSAALLALLAPCVLLCARRSREALARNAGFAAPAVLLVAGLPLAGLYAVSGPVLFALAGAAVALALVALGWRTPRVLLLPLVFLLFVCAGSRSSVRVGPQGDEPHYLMVADSLLRDHDVSLERDYAEGRYAGFHDAPLAPHFRVRGLQHAIYSLHAVGLSVLILPAWALAGYPGVTVFMALLGALLVREVRAWVAELSGHDGVAEGTAWVLALSPPLLHYAGLVFSEVPAALALTYGLRKGRSARLGPAGALAVGAAAAVLPWLNVRYAPLAVLIVVHAVWQRPRLAQIVAAAAPVLASAIGVGLYHHALYGFWDPRRVYGTRPELSIATLAEGLPGLFLDQEFGLLVHAPVLVLALPGIVLLLRRDRKLGVTVVLAIAAVVLTAGAWPMWRGGFNPPGRFLVPIVPLLFACVAMVWDRRGLTAGAALLVGWGLWVGIGGALEPQLVHRDRDGTAPFFRVLSGAREWTGLLPRYVLEEPDRHRLALVWSLALLAAVPWRARRVTAVRTAVAALGLVAAAEVAAVAGRSEAGERDAVRVVGRPALAVPGWTPTWSATAEWSPSDLGWGPLYEPHRHPAGLAVARRLPLAPGRYRVELEAQTLAGGESPRLEWAVDRPGAVWSAVALEPAPVGFVATFDVPAGGVDLRLREGPPLLLHRLRLSAQPSGP